jgi:myosin heavy subunit
MGLNVINSPLKYEEALSLRDSFAKNIYEKTFNYLIKKMNEKIEIEHVNLEDEKGANNYRKSIGLLDIFGFEVLHVNSLEQFFINFANEKLQQLYVSYIFKEEQNEFMREGLREFSHDIGFQDNKPIIDLFEYYPLGIFHLINQSSELNQDDKDLPSSIEKNHSKNLFLKIPKAKRSCFEILHSCSPVNYVTTGFTLKNKDEFPQQLLAILEKSQLPSIKKICVG